jgi:nucleotide-binding universal stress UspA family protein
MSVERHGWRRLLSPTPNEDALLWDTRGSVVVGCDASPLNEAALRFAAQAADRSGARLFVLAGFFGPLNENDPDLDLPPADLRDRARQRAEQAFTAAVPNAQRYQVVAVEGHAGRAMARLFPDARLFVVGARPRHRLGWITAADSTARYLAEHSSIPVTIFPPAWSDDAVTAGRS